INALASWLHEDYVELLDEAGVYNLKMIQEKTESMDNLINGILKYSRIEYDKLESETVDVNEVVKHIREIIFVPEHVQIVIMNPLPVIVADDTKIHQLFQNLISNAVSHIDKDEGLVKISSEESDTHWKFKIEDNGVGIAREYHEKIFKVFQSLDAKEKSTGIGLSIVKKIVDLYEGEIWLESEPGSGTCFYFTLIKK
ncbi:MAG: GHKL domain-containing protein, partial [Eudoraea sp.]|nr:GHKL domain-containing protein [Eudoraea sp.]